MTSKETVICLDRRCGDRQRITHGENFLAHVSNSMNMHEVRPAYSDEYWFAIAVDTPASKTHNSNVLVKFRVGHLNANKSCVYCLFEYFKILKNRHGSSKKGKT